MPDAPQAFHLPTPLQPKSHHAIGLHNAPIFEYDLLEFLGEGDKPLVVIEPRRGDGRAQAPFLWFASRVIEGVSETYNGAANLIVHDTAADGTEAWLLTRDVPIPVFDDKDAAVMAELEKIQNAAKAAGIRPDVAVSQAVAAGVLKPVDVRMRKAVIQLKPEHVQDVLTELFSHHVAPPAPAVQMQAIGFVGQAARIESDKAAAQKPATKKAQEHTPIVGATPPIVAGPGFEIAA